MKSLHVYAQREVPSWVRYIHTRIRNNKNFIGFIGGPTGSGKSWASISIADMLDPNFCMDNIVFDAESLMKRINSGELSPGSCIVFEEAGVALSSKNWQSTLNKIINYLFQTFRHKRFILLLNSPYMDFIDASTRKLFHAEFKTQKIDLEKQTTVIKPQLIQYNDRKDKYYYKFLRAVTPTGNKIAIKKWNVPKPSLELIEAYEKKKGEYTDKLNKEIEAQLHESKEKKEKREFRCTSCGHEWQPKGKNPSKCPKCWKNTAVDTTPPRI